STLLLDLARLADGTTQYESGLVIVDEQNSKKTAKYANEIIAEHKVLSSLSASIHNFSQQLNNELMNLYNLVDGEADQQPKQLSPKISQMMNYALK
ncbi:hypothetical protein ACNQ05_25300, partial [Enterobacter cloacae complex sp.6701062]|uniref:hypothetical protein n=1 Tax=Enterobacter cloacae complex sp.6701062 TaxID=3397177 RepID=UPI003AABA0C2